MAHDYEKSKSIALKTILLLAFITVIEVIIALLGKGYIIKGFHAPVMLIGLVMIGLSLFKAVKIIFEFMHMSYEVPAFAKSVLLPMGLLVWAVIAFMQEGNSWKERREFVNDKNKGIEEVQQEEEPKQTGSLIKELDESDFQ